MLECVACVGLLQCVSCVWMRMYVEEQWMVRMYVEEQWMASVPTGNSKTIFGPHALGLISVLNDLIRLLLFELF